MTFSQFGIPFGGQYGSRFGAHASRAARVASSLRGQPSWLVKLVMLSVLVALAALGLLVLIPALVLAGIVFVVGMSLALVRLGTSAIRGSIWRAWDSLRSVDSDGRRNVRVIRRESDVRQH